MPGKTAKVTITERQHDLLETIHKAPTASSQLRQRAAIILWAFQKRDNAEIAAAVGLSRRQVSTWRRRWADAWERLIRIECTQTHAALRRAVEQVLRDEPRAGSSGKFTPEQVVAILALACEPPEKSGRPITHWTAKELADEAIKRGIVPSISVTQVGRYLREAALQPHKKRYWLNTREKDPVVFAGRVQAVCDTYQEAPALARDQGTHTVSTDEMTGLQALERSAPDQPMTYGRPERIEAEYTRHGTLTLIGNFDVTTGELITPTIGPTRTELDFVEHIAHTVATDPEAGWIFVVDNLNIHGSEMLVRLVAKACGIAEPLGRKNVRGILEVGGQPASVPVGEGPPDPVRVHAEAQFVAEPDRDGLRSNHEEGDSARLVQFGGRPAEQAVELHRVFQSGVCQAVPLDLHRSPAAGEGGVKRGKRRRMEKPPCSCSLN